jgi:UDP-N-acetylglucosamine acyltransferase
MSAELLAAGPPRVHPSAVIESGVRLGAGVVVGPGCVIESDVTIGAGTVLGPHVTLLRFTTLGRGCRLHAGAVIGDLPQDQAYAGADSEVRIGDGCVIRECVTIHRGTRAGTATEVGEGCLLMACSHVGHNARLGRRVTLANGALLAGYTEIGDQAFISGNCLVHQFARVGRLAMMAGGSATQMDVPPFCVTKVLSPNTVISLNVVGLRRAGFSPQERQGLKRAFDLLYRSGLPVSTALAAIERQSTSGLELELCEFVRSSKRGICKFFRERAAHPADDAEMKAA